MAIGYMGPRSIPIKETAMELPMREGVNHIVSSKLFYGSVLHLKSVNIRPEAYPMARSAYMNKTRLSPTFEKVI